MESTDSPLKTKTTYHSFLLLIIVIVALAPLLQGCGKSKHDTRDADTPPPADEYHADNDIAMTVKSLADALRVGEPLDSAEYDFEGVLTDGQGMPLYTDIQGAPGEWKVNVVNPTKVMVRNLYLGDLLPNALECYLTSALGLSDADHIEVNEVEVDLDDETSVTEYGFSGGVMRIETRSGIAPNGVEGPLVNIILTSNN